MPVCLHEVNTILPEAHTASPPPGPSPPSPPGLPSPSLKTKCSIHTHCFAAVEPLFLQKVSRIPYGFFFRSNDHAKPAVRREPLKYRGLRVADLPVHARSADSPEIFLQGEYTSSGREKEYFRSAYKPANISGSNKREGSQMVAV